LDLIGQKKYFVLHAPRQTGKTSCLLALMDNLNHTGKYRCLYFNVEIAQSAREDVKRGMDEVDALVGDTLRKTVPGTKKSSIGEKALTTKESRCVGSSDT